MRVAALLIASIALACPVGAQTPSGSPVASEPPIKAVKAKCQAEVSATGVSGPARYQQIVDCVRKQLPAIADRMQCHTDPVLRTMDKEAKHVAITACIRKLRG